MNTALRLFHSFLVIILTVLAAWQVQRGNVGWVIFDVALSAILLAMLLGRKS